jgi:ApbE superfamily uncharacterized protein (UPF0280 family)
LIGDAYIRRIGDGRRLHFNHGPIDIIALAEGDATEIDAAYAQAGERFTMILEELVADLPRLREPVSAAYPLLKGAVARRMESAVRPHGDVYVTPMAAVAGSVADEILAALVAGRDLARVYVNNGGDIAFHLAPGQHFNVGIVDNADAPDLDGRVRLTYDMPVRGLATSGWRGRSHSLGVADAVTVLATCTAKADVAATLIANAVNVEHAAVERAPANTISDDSDLGDFPVTVMVGDLPRDAIEQALDAGVACATAMQARDLIFSAYLSLQGQVKTAGADLRLPAAGGAT